MHNVLKPFYFREAPITRQNVDIRPVVPTRGIRTQQRGHKINLRCHQMINEVAKNPRMYFATQFLFIFQTFSIIICSYDTDSFTPQGVRNYLNQTT